MAGIKGEDRVLYQRIGYAVMKLRQREGLTALVLAERAGVHRNTIYRVESALYISVSSLCRIAGALGVGVDALISFSPSLVHSRRVVSLGQEKAAKVVCGTENLFGSPNPSPARPASTTTVGSSKGRSVCLPTAFESQSRIHSK